MYMKRNVLVYLFLIMVSATAWAASTLWTKVGEAGANYLGTGACGGADFNNDGFKDIVVAANGFGTGKNLNQGKLYVFSGADNGATTLFSVTGEAKSDFLGFAGGAAGDVNNDGYEDVIVGAYGWNGGYGKVYVYAGNASGAKTLLYSKDGKSLGLTKTDRFAQYGIAKSAGDVNGDGYDDFAVSADRASNGNGKVFVWSGQNGNLLYSKTGSSAGNLGFNLAFADVNGDGYSDLIASEHATASSKGQVRVYLGPSGTEASYSPLVGENAGDNFGRSLASAGHFSSATHEDILVGAYNYSGSGLSLNGKVYVYSGDDGHLVASVEGPANTNHYGYVVNGAGDFNHDGFDDIMLSNQNDREVRVYAGPDLGSGTPLSTRSQPAVGSFGSNICPVGNTTADLFPEIVIAAPNFSTNGSNDGKVFVETFSP